MPSLTPRASNSVANHMLNFTPPRQRCWSPYVWTDPWSGSAGPGIFVILLIQFVVACGLIISFCVDFFSQFTGFFLWGYGRHIFLHLFSEVVSLVSLCSPLAMKSELIAPAHLLRRWGLQDGWGRLRYLPWTSWHAQWSWRIWFGSRSLELFWWRVGQLMKCPQEFTWYVDHMSAVPCKENHFVNILPFKLEDPCISTVS